VVAACVQGDGHRAVGLDYVVINRADRMLHRAACRYRHRLCADSARFRVASLLGDGQRDRHRSRRRRVSRDGEDRVVALVDVSTAGDADLRLIVRHCHTGRVLRVGNGVSLSRVEARADRAISLAEGVIDSGHGVLDSAACRDNHCLCADSARSRVIALLGNGQRDRHRGRWRRVSRDGEDHIVALVDVSASGDADHRFIVQHHQPGRALRIGNGVALPRVDPRSEPAISLADGVVGGGHGVLDRTACRDGRRPRAR